ncbi:MAG TPA: hypothetical protein VJM11_00435 [Nevskiaceae bacterium]|nr:hypothetical protein [Nevskiaceae bacterium]
MPAFLSDDWFATAQRLEAEAGDVPVATALAAVVLNFTVPDSRVGVVDFHLERGTHFVKGHDAAGLVRLTMPASVAKQILVDWNRNAAMQALLSGKIAIEGSKMKLMALQTMPTEKHRALLDAIDRVTET